MIAAVVVVAAVVFLAVGRGGELSAERNDYAPLDLGPVTATDVALLRPPTGLWGYNMQATDEAMERIAESIRERDVRIVALEQLVTDLNRDHASVPPLGAPCSGARHRREPAATVETAAAQAPSDASATEQVPQVTSDEAAWSPGTPAADETAWSPSTSSTDDTAEPSGPSADASSAPPEESHD